MNSASGDEVGGEPATGCDVAVPSPSTAMSKRKTSSRFPSFVYRASRQLIPDCSVLTGRESSSLSGRGVGRPLMPLALWR